MSVDADLLSFLTHSDDVKQFRSSIERMLAREYSLARRRQTIEQGGSIDRALWRTMGELGWFAACLPERFGGYAESATSALVLLEQFGREMVVEPLLSGFIVPAAAITAAEGDAAGARLAKLFSGEELWALAWSEAHDPNADLQKDVIARRDAKGWRLSGSKLTVLSGPLADFIIVSALAEQGPTLFVVPRPNSFEAWPCVDGQIAADFVLDDVRLPEDAVLGQPGEGMRPLRAALNWGAAGACAEAIGAMQGALTTTLDYARTRKQFGQAIAGFQVVQHRLAAMAIELEYARSLLPVLAMELSRPGDRQQARISAVRAKITGAARRVASDAVQLHGGIGVTHEAAVSHHFRRIVALELAWGDERLHLERYRESREPGSDLLAV